jgi:hypothetical protein
MSSTATLSYPVVSNAPKFEALNPAQESSAPETVLFEKHVISNQDQLKELHDSGRLRGAFIITGDMKHVGIHKIFHLVQEVCRAIEHILGLHREKFEFDLNANLCHGMIALGWDEHNPEKNRPLLAHSVTNGVKVNAVNYFTYDDHDVDHMVIYIPKDAMLREEYAANAEKAATHKIGKAPACKFAWKKLFLSMFRQQVRNKPTSKMGKELAYAVADVLQNRPISSTSSDKKTRSMFCMEFALLMLQVSVLTKAMSEEEKNSYSKMSRNKAANEIVAKLAYHDEKDTLSNTYWSSKVCTRIDPTCTMSSYGACILDKISEMSETAISAA